MNLRASLAVFLSLKCFFPVHCSNNLSSKRCYDFADFRNYKKSLLKRFQSTSVDNQESNTENNHEQLDIIHSLESTNHYVSFPIDAPPFFSASNSYHQQTSANQIVRFPPKQAPSISSNPTSTPVELLEQMNSKAFNEETELDFIVDSSIMKNYRLTTPKIPHVQRDPMVIPFSCGILSWSNEDTNSMLHHMNFCFGRKKNEFCLYFGSGNYDNLIFFQYAANIFDLFTKNEKVLNDEFKLKAIKSIYAIFPTITSLPSHLIPFYYSLSSSRNNSLNFTNRFTKAPFYFLFTTISYLMKNEQNENAQFLKPLLKHAYRRILDGRKLKTKEWNFLKDRLSQYFDISDLCFGVRTEHKNIQFDLSSVSFIYHEMRFSSSQSIKSLFRQIWKVSTGERKPMDHFIQISSSPVIFIPPESKICLNVFKREARKLYQIEFTNMLFKKWNQMEDLLKEFSELKFHFELVIIDFRFRVFSSNDFKLLDKVLEHIYSLLEKFSFNDKSQVLSFLIELEYFINFKCFLFIFDLCSEFEKNNINWSPYQTTLETIDRIFKSFSRIRSFISSRKITFSFPDFDAIQLNFWENLNSLKEHIRNLPLNLPVNSTELAKEMQAKFDKLSLHLSHFSYFQHEFSELSISRFECAKMIAKLDDVLATNNENCIKEILFDEKYASNRRMCNLMLLENVKKSTLENKRRFFKRFQSFLLFNNQ